MKTAQILTLALAAILCQSGCGRKATPGEDDSAFFEGLQQTVPSSWEYLELTSQDTALTPTGLDDPLKAVVVFDKDYSQFSDTPSVILFFYPIEQKAAIDTIIRAQGIYSWCIPIAFAQSQDYYVVTSPCYLSSMANREDSLEVDQIKTIITEYIVSH